MSTSPSKRYYTPEEYLALEERALDKHEYFQGEIVAMSGGTPEHDRIGGRIYSLLDMYLDGKSCEVFSSNMRVKTNSGNVYTYPDDTIACNAQFEKIAGVQTLINPVAIFEVLSESTESIDRGKKLGQYIRIPSLREYLIVAQDEMRVDHLARTVENNWRLAVHTEPDAIIHLECISFDLRLADIYRRVTFQRTSEE